MDEKIVIKRGLKIGELDAEADQSLLDHCYIDNGQLSNILDIESPASIVVGRTGSGKSAMPIEYHRMQSTLYFLIQTIYRSDF